MGETVGVVGYLLAVERCAAATKRSPGEEEYYERAVFPVLSGHSQGDCFSGSTIWEVNGGFFGLQATRRAKQNAYEK